MIDENILKTVESYQNAWNRMDFDALAALWDRSDPAIYYVAEEIDAPFHHFDAVVDYWKQAAAAVESVTMSMNDQRVRSLTPDLAVVTYQMHVDLSMRGSSELVFKPIGIDIRVSAILRKTSSGWRYIHYAESPLGALPFVRRAYNANVREQ